MHTEHLFRVHLYYWWALDFGIDTGELPIVPSLDVVGVVIDLRFIAGQLFFIRSSRASRGLFFTASCMVVTSISEGTWVPPST